MRIAVFGAGAWGTALAIQAARAGCDVTLWARDAARAEVIAAARPGVPAGVLSGPNFDLYAHLARIAPALRVQASGGVSGLGDVREARERGCAGIVLGRALLEGRFTVAEALQC